MTTKCLWGQWLPRSVYTLSGSDQGLPCQLKESLHIVEYIDAGFCTNSLLAFFVLLPKSCFGISKLRDKDPDWCMNHQCKFNFIYFWLWCQTQRPLISNPEGKQCWCIWTAICLLWIGQFSTKECWYLSFWVTSSWFKKGSCQLLAKYVSKVLVNCIEEGVWLSEAKVLCILLHRGVQLILANSWGRPANLVSCILLHRGIQLILANSWGRPANLAVGKGGGGGGVDIFISSVSSLSSVFLFLPWSSLSSPLLSLLSPPFLWEMTQNDLQGLMCH